MPQTLTAPTMPKPASFRIGNTPDRRVAERARPARFDQAVARLMSEIAAGEASAAGGAWIDERDILAEFGAAR